MTAHSWVRNVRIINADSAIYMWGSMFNTVSDVEITTSADRGKHGAGHRAIWLEHGAENLVTRWVVRLGGRSGRGAREGLGGGGGHCSRHPEELDRYYGRKDRACTVDAWIT